MAEANAITHKKCTACEAVLPILMFALCGQGDRRRGTCKPCTSLRHKSREAARRAADGPKPDHIRCNKCSELKPFNKEYFKAKNTTWGLAKECRKCNAERNAAWKKTEKGKLLIRRSNKKNKEKIAAYARRYQAKNREKISAYVSAWRSRDIERHRENDRLWKRKHKDKAEAYRHARRAAGVFDRSIAKQLLMLQKCRCAICRTSIRDGYEIDHIMPVSLGGSNASSNLQLLCMRCNRRKGANDPIRYMNSLGFLL